MDRIALYTTIYPGVEPFLTDWYCSVEEQTDRGFRLWVGLDQLEPGEVERAVGTRVDAIWAAAKPGSTPAQVREESLSKIVDDFDAVILVDSDDMLHPTRVAAAREALKNFDVAACALRLVDHQRCNLGKTLTHPRERVLDELLPRNNVFGFSNSAYRSNILRDCLPIPAESVLVDWLLATRAWLLGARLGFDQTVQMDYRQHGANIAGIRFPFEVNQIVQSTARVREHYRFLQSFSKENVVRERWAKIQEAAEDVELFWEGVVMHPEKLEMYVRDLNALEPQTVWWWEVAQPELQRFWKEHAGEAYEACRN